MPVKVHCPLCGTEMTVGSAAMGTTVGCPWCRHRFRPESVLGESADRSPADSEAALATPPAVEKSVGKTPAEKEPARRPSAGERSQREAVAAKPDVAAGVSSPKKPDTPVVALPPKKDAKLPPAKQSGGPEAVVREAKQPVAAPAQPRETPPVQPRETPQVARPPVKQPRPQVPPPDESGPTIPQRKVARMILTQPAEATWTLTPDGSLPSLHLEEPDAARQEKEKPRSSNPVLLIVVLCGSLATTLILLFADTSSHQRGTREQKEQARQILAAEYYTNLNPNAPLAEYQILLREAHWAHSRGDEQRAKELYRQVLLLLYAEGGRNTYTGLTGSRSRDEKLEQLLNVLLRD